MLWSHYTQNHKGFRIWINLSLIASLPITTCDVIYNDDLLSIDVNDLYSGKDVLPFLKEAMVTKAKCWNYEDEVRAFTSKEYCKLEEVGGKTLEYINISLESVTRIDFGIRFPIEERDKLIERRKVRGLSGIKFFQCGLSYDEYAIEYEEL
ncbi:MAG: DUF2971 domain-containing protein [Candidatus Scalindua sp.]|nr:DUF2971 domain-containing protein [Candidatus Scalindua sp.]MBT6230719.1 DUF2971 domain-containing protein [Candidatus Scalindua sp.]MBT6562615.1 DUF2971 domain-containing protein [Candidatus Scalindua sp.]MBT7211912.1 DUF2971 domain-containing protein [Candidatus Scalindua sp.]MBT7589631.1 DUF2971 domain-containing protein [Candidatus Scalindua sp.]